MKEAITDEMMMQVLSTTKVYTLVVLRKGPKYGEGNAQQIIWEHVRQNLSLRADGLLSIVCPVKDDSEMAGIGIFDADAEQTKNIMDNDPAIKAGVLVYEIHPTRSFPKDSLPE